MHVDSKFILTYIGIDIAIHVLQLQVGLHTLSNIRD